MSSILLKNVRVFGQPNVNSCLIENMLIKKFNSDESADKVIDCNNDLLLPSLWDQQAFYNNIEDLNETAIKSGFSYVFAVLADNRLQKGDAEENEENSFEKIHLIYHKKRIVVRTLDPITVFDNDGVEKLAETPNITSYMRSNGNAVITDNDLMRRAMLHVKDLQGSIDHLPQDPVLAADGVMHEGKISAELGLKGIPPEAETIMLARDLELVRMTGCLYQATQISTARSVEMIRLAKKEGLPVYCGVSINHLLLNETAIGEFRTFCKLTPPLRTEADRLALIEGVKDDTINFIVSAHNPQTQEGKRLPFEFAEYGSIGLETFLPAIFLLHQQENIPLETLLKKITSPFYKLEEGKVANIVCFDDQAEWQLDVATHPLPSKTQNSALDGTKFSGKITMTIINGEIKFNARAN